MDVDIAVAEHTALDTSRHYCHNYLIGNLEPVVKVIFSPGTAMPVPGSALPGSTPTTPSPNTRRSDTPRTAPSTQRNCHRGSFISHVLDSSNKVTVRHHHDSWQRPRHEGLNPSDVLQNRNGWPLFYNSKPPSTTVRCLHCCTPAFGRKTLEGAARLLTANNPWP